MAVKQVVCTVQGYMHVHHAHNTFPLLLSLVSEVNYNNNNDLSVLYPAYPIHSLIYPSIYLPMFGTYLSRCMGWFRLGNLWFGLNMIGFFGTIGRYLLGGIYKLPLDTRDERGRKVTRQSFFCGNTNTQIEGPKR